MIVWRGLGIWVFACVFGVSFVAQSLTIVAFGKDYWTDHSWPFGSAMIVAGGLILIIDRMAAKHPVRNLIDEKTGERVMLNINHDLFFVPIKWWSAIMPAIGLAVIATGWTP